MEDKLATDAILESISDGVFTVDGRWRITSFNRAAERITGIPREEAIGRPCHEVFRASMCETDCALGRTLANGEPIINRPAYIIDAAGRRIPISVSTAILRDAGGNPAGGAETFRDLSVEERLREDLSGRFRVGDMVSRSPAMRRIFELLPRVAAADTTVLIQGETGTGKGLLARALHAESRRRKGPFIAVNCGALPETLLESELFGHKAGAFTGASHDRPGRFAQAEGGALFLDEIGEVSPALQIRLLQYLQDKTYEPLGGAGALTSDARVIAATNRDLAALVEEGRFRQDLYYRINVFAIALPPLRRRKADIPLLADHFIARFNHRHGKAIRSVAPETLARLMAHDFPGNIRELENMIEHAFVLCDGDAILPHHLPGEMDLEQTAPRDAPPVPDGQMTAAVETLEARLIREALERNNWNRTAAARSLGIHKSTLYRKIHALGIRSSFPPDRHNHHPDPIHKVLP